MPKQSFAARPFAITNQFCFFLAAVLSTASLSAAERILVDFGRGVETTTSPDLFARHWNNLPDPGLQTNSSIVNEAGDLTDITIAVTDAFQAVSTNSLGGETIYVPTATGDFAYVNKTSDTTAKILVSGLNAAKVYDLKFFVSSNRQAPQSYLTNYTVAGNSTQMVSLEAVGNLNNVASVAGMAPNGSGQIEITIAAAAASTEFGGIGVLEIVGRDPSEPEAPDPEEIRWSDAGLTPNPPAEAGGTNPDGLVAYVWELADGNSEGHVGAGESLRRAGFHVKPLPLDRPPFEFADDADLILFGSFVSEDRRYKDYMDTYGDVLDDYIDRGGYLVQLSQANQIEFRPPFLPASQDAMRLDEDFHEAFVLSPSHPMIQGFPLNGGGRVSYTQPHITSHTDNVIWEAFSSFSGFEVILSGDEHARFPALMETAYGQGRLLLAAMAPDKILDVSTGVEQADAAYGQFNQAFFDNLYVQTRKVRDGEAPPINVTPQPNIQTGLLLHASFDEATVGDGDSMDTTASGMYPVYQDYTQPGSPPIYVDVLGNAHDFRTNPLSRHTTEGYHVTSGYSGRLGEALRINNPPPTDSEPTVNPANGNGGVNVFGVPTVRRGSYTISLWVNFLDLVQGSRTDTTVGGAFLFSIGGNASSSGREGISIYYDKGSGCIVYRFSSGSSTDANPESGGGVDPGTGGDNHRAAVSLPITIDDQWKMVTMVIDSDGSSVTVSGYVNGSSVGTLPGGGGAIDAVAWLDSDGLNNPLDTIVLGTRAGLPGQNGPNNYTQSNPRQTWVLRGALDDLAMWDRAMSAEQVQSLYQQALGGTNAGSAIIPSIDSYETWASSKALTGPDALSGSDPDKDGRTNFEEFAFDGDPLSGTSDGKIVGKVVEVSGQPALTLTVPVRNGAIFASTAGGQLMSKRDGVIYRIQGSGNLADWNLNVAEVTGSDVATIQADLPALSSGWRYKTFRTPGIIGGTSMEFIRAVVESP